MSIIASELKLLRSAVVSNAGTNGGRMANSVVTSAVAGNVFPNVSSAQRAAGLIDYRKLFYKNVNEALFTLFNSKLFQDTNSDGDDRYVWWPTTQTSVQSGITGSERKYGMGYLNADVGVSATQITVLVEEGATVIFVDGDEIRISDKVTPDAVSGSEEYVVIDSIVSVIGDVVTIDLATPLVNAYDSSTPTKVSSVYESGDLVANLDAGETVVVSGAGVFDSAQVQLYNEGTVLQTYTLTFTDATNFNISGDTLGSLGTGNVSAGVSVYGEEGFAGEYQVLVPPAAFSGTWIAGNTVTFTTYPSGQPFFVKRTVPAGAGVATGNFIRMVLNGETP